MQVFYMIVALLVLGASFIITNIYINYEPYTIDNASRFLEWKETYRKSYPTEEEEAYRYQRFIKNLQFIVNQNRIQNRITYRINQFMDLRQDEFQKMYLDNEVKAQIPAAKAYAASTPSKQQNLSAIDWRIPQHIS